MNAYKYLVLVLVVGLFSCGPQAKFIVVDDESEKPKAPAVINFENQSKNAETYSWDFGDGTSSDSPNPSHKYQSSGIYEVVLKAKKGNRMDEKTKQVQINAPEKCLVEITTEMGVMIVELYDATPKHRDNFVKLVEEGFYNDLIFHRVINGFMIQGGDPESRNARPNAGLGSGGPGYTVEAEFVDTLIHRKGALAAARLSDAANPNKESSGSQFYIVQGRPLTEGELVRNETMKGFYYPPAQKEAYLEHGGTPFLDREYTVFGQVIEGLEVIDAIAAVKTNSSSRPAEDVKMKIRVIK